MVVCLTSARFNMKADILRQGEATVDNPDTTDNEGGHWIIKHDPESNEIIRVWQPKTQDDPSTPDTNEGAQLESFRCLARCIIDGGIRVAGTT